MAKKYDDSSISSLKGADRIRKRVGVMLGSNDIQGTQHAVFEIISNSIDEARSGYGDTINITIGNDNSIEVEDFGRGVPMDYNKAEDRYNWELIFCEMYSGSKYSNDSYDFSLGINGLGTFAAQASSEWFKVESRRDGKIFKMAFEKGEPVGQLIKEKDTSKPQKTGTKQIFKPDIEVFTDINIDKEWYLQMLKEQAIVNAGLTFNFIDKRDGTKETIVYPDGVLGFAKELAGNETLTDAINFTFEGAGKDRADKPNYKVKGEVVILFGNKNPNSLYFHNSSPLLYGGSPRRAKEKALLEFFKTELKKTDSNRAKELEFDDIQDSMIFLSNTFSTETSYENQTKRAINNKFIEEFLAQQITKFLKEWAKENPLELEKVTNQVSINVQSRKSATAQKLATKQKLSNKMKLDDRIKNFVDCRNKNPEDRELFICLKGDTKIKLLDGTSPTIESLVGKTDLWGYSTDNIGRMIPARIKEVFKTQDVSTTIRLTFSDSSTIECTPEHLFLDRDSLTWWQASDLYEGQSLASMKFKIGDSINTKGRPMVWIPEQYEKYNSRTKKKQGHWELIHQRVAKLLHIASDFDGKQHMNIHHKDLNVFNNSPDNLEFLSASEHRTIHNVLWHDSGKQKEQFYNMPSESWKRMTNGYKNWTSEGKEAIRQGTINSWKNNTNPERTWAHYNKTAKHAEDLIKLKRTRQIKIGKAILTDGLEITEENWKKYRTYNFVGGLNNVIKTFGSLSQFIEEVVNYNLQVTDIEYIHYATPIPVYCLNIDSDFHSFVLDNGIITHNCEGLSAMGSLKQARNGETQALLAIRGKILNTLKADYSSIFKNELIMDIMKLVGTGVEMHGGKGKNNLGNFDINNRRFDKIILATDQDTDGCFTGDTKIKSLDGNTYTFEELVNNNITELWVYSKDENGEVVPAKAVNPRVTKETTELVELTFENGFVVRCTPDHRILLNDGTYKEAQRLTPNDSISSIYFRYGHPKGYLQYTSKGSNWKWVHQEVNDYLNSPTRQELVDNITDDNHHNFRGGEVVVHHKNHNKFDNRPDNLVAMYNKQHGILHITEYNRSQEKRDALNRKRQDAKYNAWFSSRVAKGLIKYNRSDKHRQQVAQMNKNPEIIRLQKLSMCSGVISYLSLHNVEITEQNYNEFIHKKRQSVPRWGKMISYLQESNISLADFIVQSKQHRPNSGVEKDTNCLGKFRKQIANIISQTHDFNEESYMRKRKELNSRSPKWVNILNYFSSYDEAYNFAKLYNHRIKSVQHIICDKPIKVYDLTVPGYENFMVCVDDDNMEGIIVHNCHIIALCLTLFYRLTPELIKQGYVYFLDTPLYEIQILDGKDKGKMLYAFTDQEMKDMTDGVKCKVSRNKGLGEVDYQTMAIFMSPETRHLTRVTMDDAKEAEKYLELFMGNDSADRKEYITLHGKEYTDLDLE